MYKNEMRSAVKSGNSAAVKDLISKGADVNMQYEDGDAVSIAEPIIHAVRHGKISVVKTLIESHAKLNVKDNGDCTPADIAKRRGDKEMIECFTKHGAGSTIL